MKSALLLLLARLMEQPLSTTKIQKLAFLASKQHDIPIAADFAPYRFGPWSAEIQTCLEELKAQDFLDQSFDLSGDVLYTVSTAGEDFLLQQDLLRLMLRARLFLHRLKKPKSFQ